MNINEKIYRNVKALAEINGIDMKDIEARIGRSVGWLSRKNSKIDAETLMKLAEILDISIEDLMLGDYEHKLKEKKALEAVSAAIVAALEFFNRDGLDTFVQNVINQHCGGKG